MQGLKLYDLNDRDLLSLVDDLKNEDTGYTSTQDLAKRLSSNEDQLIHFIRCIGTRMAWMVRYGAVERHQDKKKSGFWRLTPIGESLMRSRLTQGQVNMFQRAEEGKLLAATAVVSERFVGAQSPTTAHLMRREWQRGMMVRRVGPPS